MNHGQVVSFPEDGWENERDDQLLKLPEKLHQRLMPFQREGVKFALSRGGRCMIADEMGLGKTLQAISVAYVYKQEWPLLIVVPSSLKYPWIEEMEKWLPDLDPEDIHLVENKADVEGISRSMVTVLGYGLLTSDARALVQALTQRDFGVVLVDESHYLKSRNAARSQILVPLIQKARRAVLLTGTPALGRPEELFTQIDALYPRRFGSWSEYAKRYCDAHYRFFGSHRQWDCRGASHLDELNQRLGDVMVRRLKRQVLTQLPPKIRQRILFDLPKEAAKEAIGSFEEWEKLMRTLDLGVSDDTNPFVRVMELVTRVYKQTAVAKAGAVKEYIRMMLENEKLKFLVFGHHLTMLQACTEAVVEAKARYIRIDGSVPSSERVRLVHQFQNDPDTQVAILSIQAAGQGLTFTAASHVVFAELYWNPGHVKQAEDRAHRIGQSSSVNVHYLIAKGTFDDIMWAMLNRKETVTGSTLNGRKEYLRADVGDRDKWEFLSFANVWTPSNVFERGPRDDEDAIFFTHFDKDKQRDIRTFFSPSSDNKRKRTQEEEEGPTQGEVQTPTEEAGGSLSRERPHDDFSPQVKRWRCATPRLARGRRCSSSGKAASPLSPWSPRRLSGGTPRVSPQGPPANQGRDWSCGSCTYTNSSLLPYCEMCECPRSCGGDTGPTVTSTSPCDALPTTGGDADPPNPHISLPGCEEEKESCRLDPKQSGGQDPDSRAGPSSLHLDQEDGALAPNTSSPTTHPRGEPSPLNNQKKRAFSPANRHYAYCCILSMCESTGHVPLYESLTFRASRNTDRIYVYTKDATRLNCSFVPLDIKLDSWDDLPACFCHRKNRMQILRFVEEWSSLTAMKQRVVRRSGHLFQSPVLLLDELTSDQRRRSVTKRYLTKEDVAQASLSKAQAESGSVRHVSTQAFFARRKSTQVASSDPDQKDGCSSGVHLETPGYLQAVDSLGNPLCLSCQSACGMGVAWDARFCQRSCQEEFMVRSSQAYMRAHVFEAEQGVCQHCGLQAHQLFQHVRDAPPAHRKEILDATWLAQLPLKQLNEMIRSPSEGQFWQVDHIRPVYRGGGQCSLDNLQTLCTMCHKARTAQQAKDRSQMKKGIAASKVSSDITRYFIKNPSLQ